MTNKIINLIETLDWYIEEGLISDYTIKRIGNYDCDIHYTCADKNIAHEIKTLLIEKGYIDRTLEELLQDAIDDERFEEAAKLVKKIKKNK